jgi:hypothetical protein
MAMEVTLGTGMSCISSVCRAEDNGSDNEDNLDDRQQKPNSSSPSVPCGKREIKDDQRSADEKRFLSKDGRWRR